MDSCGAILRTKAQLRRCKRGGGKRHLRKPRNLSVALLNVDFTAATALGVTTMLSGLTLFQVRSFRPESARDSDVFFGSVLLLVGGVLVFQGWRLDPILLFSQLLTASTALYFGYEAVRLRGLETRRVSERQNMAQTPPQNAFEGEESTSGLGATMEEGPPDDEDVPGAYYAPPSPASSAHAFASSAPPPLETDEAFSGWSATPSSSDSSTSAFDAGFEEGRAARLRRSTRDREAILDTPFDDWEPSPRE